MDRFILARLEQAGLRPQAEAERSALARRVALDLTGLPPTAEEVRAFEQDRSADAYERLVDRQFVTVAWHPDLFGGAAREVLGAALSELDAAPAESTDAGDHVIAYQIGGSS